MRDDGTHRSRRQVHPRPDTTGELEALRGCVFTLLPCFTYSSRFFPLGYPPPWLVWVQTITFHRVLNNEKKGGFSFFAAGGPTPRDDSAQSNRRENALPGSEVPPPSTTSTGRWGGTVPSCGTVDSSTFISLMPAHTEKKNKIHIFTIVIHFLFYICLIWWGTYILIWFKLNFIYTTSVTSLGTI